MNVKKQVLLEDKLLTKGNMPLCDILYKSFLKM